ncbi:MAG TPA: ornithine carbamoyltransferase [Iamia sp.]|nr:ornithine carbamoyltransferase [Iamia sp.]
MPGSLRGRSFVKELDHTADELLGLVDLARRLEAAKRAGAEVPRLGGRNIALIFEKTSTRTRCAFEVAAHDQGAHVTYLDPSGSQIGHKESAEDTARVLGRMYDGIEYRGASQEVVETLARCAGVPVWNGLTDDWHPTQMLADVLTMREHAPGPVAELSVCFVGDGRNNVARSLLVTGAILGMDVRICAPSSLQPDADLRRTADKLAAESGARVLVTDDVGAVEGVGFVYTDVWVSMGEPPERWAERIDLLLPYQVDAELMALAGPQARFMHCLPAFHDRGTVVGDRLFQQTGLSELEVTHDVFTSDRSVVFDQAENRMHTIKAVLVATMGG